MLTPDLRQLLAPSASSVLNTAGRSGPSAVRAAPVRVARSISRSGFSSSASTERVGQHQPAFRIGVADLHRQALARAPDVSGPDRRSPPTLFSTAGISTRSSIGACKFEQQLSQRQRAGRAAHVFLHQQHRGWGLQIQSAAVKAHALAHQRDARRPGPAPATIDQPRCARRCRPRPRRSADSHAPARRRCAPATRRQSAAASASAAAASSSGPSLIGRSVDQIAAHGHRLRRGLRIATVRARWGDQRIGGRRPWRQCPDSDSVGSCPAASRAQTAWPCAARAAWRAVSCRRAGARAAVLRPTATARRHRGNAAKTPDRACQAAVVGRQQQQLVALGVRSLARAPRRPGPAAAIAAARRGWPRSTSHSGRLAPMPGAVA